jgi:hypothetical protein
LNGKPFKANWGLGNALKKTARLQIKPPSDWDKAEVYQALEVVLAAHQSKPWYGAIDDSLMGLISRSIKGQGKRCHRVCS